MTFYSRDNSKMGLRAFYFRQMLSSLGMCFISTQLLTVSTGVVDASAPSARGIRSTGDDGKNFCRCGGTTDSKSKDQGGQATPPWEAVILRRDEIDYDATPTKICSGTILNEKMILTSVLCAKKDRVVAVPLDEAKLRKLPTLGANHVRSQLTTSNLEVWLGIRNESFLNESGGFMFSVKEIIVHPNYTENLGSIPDWDYAILVLETRLEFSKLPNIYPACMLPSTTTIQYAGQPVRTHFWRFVPPTFDTVYLRVEATQLLSSATSSILFPNQQCKEKALKKEWISERYICSAEGLQTNAGSGQFIQVGNHVPLLIGVGSYNSLFGTNGKQDFKQIALIGDLLYGRLFIDQILAKEELSTCEIDTSIMGVPATPPPSSKTLDELEPFDFSRRPWLQFTSEYRRVLPISAGCRCGIRKRAPTPPVQQLSPYIWHGTEFDTPYEFYWHANLGAPSGLHNLVCGGSLINDRLVLTAAHCITYEGSTPQKRTFVKFRGKDNFMEDTANDTYAIYSFVDPDAQSTHPDYYRRNGTKRNGESHRYDSASFDVGVLVLNNSLDISSAPDLGTACLPFTGEYLKIEGDVATVIGNGFWHKGGFSGIPQKLNFTVSDLNLCRKQYLDWDKIDKKLKPNWKGFDHIIADTVICHGVGAIDNNYTGQAVGDSGSSVFIRASSSDGGDEQMIQVGIVSSGVTRKIVERAHRFNLTLPEDPQLTQLMTGVMDHETLSYIDYLSFYFNVSWCSRALLS